MFLKCYKKKISHSDGDKEKSKVVHF